jgi:hypothetical protein
MDFDIVIATCNRLVALQLSIPLMLRQSRLPKKFIIVDSSEDSGAVESAVRAIFLKWASPVVFEFFHSSASSTLQRNLGLARVESPIVFFPDDDSIWFPGFTESIMQIYERDELCEIAGISGSATLDPPDGFFSGSISPGYRVAKRDRSRFVEPLSDFAEKLFFPDSFSRIGQLKIAGRNRPAWLPTFDSVICDFMTGFRMTFRTQVIRACPFDELLDTYALYEDRDASLGALDQGFLVCATRAKVYHHRVPSLRTSGFKWGVIQVLNRAYVVYKHTDPGHPARRGLRRYIRYRLARYILQAHSVQARERIKGLRRALRCLPLIENATKDNLRAAYTKSVLSCSDAV